MPITEETVSISIIEIIGYTSVILILLAITISIIALILRNFKFSLFASCSMISFGFLSMGLTFWGLSESNQGHLTSGYGVDPSTWFAEFSLSTARAGSVLPACAIGMFLVGVSFLLTKKPKTNEANKNGEQGAVANH